jgi:hypothetical protein
MSECGIIGLFFGCKSPATVTGCSPSASLDANTIKITGTSLEHAMEKSGADICATESDTYLSVMGKERAGADSLWVNLAKIVFEIPGLKAKFEALNDGQQRFAVERLGRIISEKLEDEKASLFKSWGPFHYFGCKTRLYGYKTPSLVDIKITADDVKNILNSQELQAIKGVKSGTGCDPADLVSKLSLYNQLSLIARGRTSVILPKVSLFYAGDEKDVATLPSDCRIKVENGSTLASITKVPPAESVKVEAPAEAGAQKTAIAPMLLRVEPTGTISLPDAGRYTIKLECQKPGKFELKLGTLAVKAGGERPIAAGKKKKIGKKKKTTEIKGKKKIEKKKKVDKGVSGRDIF